MLLKWVDIIQNALYLKPEIVHYTNFSPKNDRPSNTTILPGPLQHIDIKIEGTRKYLFY
jgi:hypothetical protein